MGDVITGELVDQELAARHEALVRDFVYGVARMCIALHRIREEKTYKAKGFGSYGEFLKRQGISLANGRLFANAGPVFVELKKTNDEILIKHVDMLKPIYKIPNAAKQATIIRAAKDESHRQLVPLTADLISDVAERRFGWKKPKTYREESKRKRLSAPGADEVQMRDDLQRAFRVIALTPLSGYEVVQRLGSTDSFDDFAAAFQLMEDMRDA